MVAHHSFLEQQHGVPEPGRRHSLLIDELFCFLISLAQALGKHWENEQQPQTQAKLVYRERAKIPEVLRLTGLSLRRLRTLGVGHANKLEVRQGGVDCG